MRSYSFASIVLTSVLLSFYSISSYSQPLVFKSGSDRALPLPVSSARPLDQLTVYNPDGSQITVFDGQGRVYFTSSQKPFAGFRVGGSLGNHQVKMKNSKGMVSTATIKVETDTRIDDAGYYKNMFDLFYRGMCVYDADGEESIEWNGKIYRYFVQWGLDHCHTMKGMKYFKGSGAEFVDLMKAIQRNDGMIWSFVHTNTDVDYFLTRDKYTGYTRKIGNRFFTRQPTENHPEYIYVNTIYQCWKSSGDDQWMKSCLPSAAKALDYGITDPARWSKRFKLLKRVYTIDSWDFAVEDEYMPDIGLTNSMIIDPEKSKFGIFFGDNTGYIKACKELAEMYRYTGMQDEAKKFDTRAEDFLARLNALVWNGKFFRHFIDEDSTVKRNLGVDESSQIAQSNAYSLNRFIRNEQKKAIIETYLHLKKSLPPGSPGEWYSIYPPFQKGFERHNAIWQYMNGGVGGHVAGELALGAFSNGYEQYGTDILNRLFELGKKYDNKIWFAYTGSIPAPPPAPVFKPIDLAPYTNMDHFDQGTSNVFPWMNSKRKGDDLRELPLGDQQFANIHFKIIDPSRNGRKSVVAVSRQKNFPKAVQIPFNDTAGCIYLLHTSTKPSSEQVAGVVTFVYADSSRKTNYMIMDKHLTYWWFSKLNTDYSGIAWYGKNQVSEGVGLSWCAINNPSPSKKISHIVLQAPEDDGIYTTLAVSASNREHYVPVKATSFGGPDNWAAAIAMQALLEGLAGVRNEEASQALQQAIVEPRWTTTHSDSIDVCVHFPASGGYVSYNLINRRQLNRIDMLLTGSGKKITLRVLLPHGIKEAKSVTADSQKINFRNQKSGNMVYAECELDPVKVTRLRIEY